MGSLARNNLTFCPIKCFFFVLVLLALTGAALVQLDDMSPAEFSSTRLSLSFKAFTQRKSLQLRALNSLQVHRARCPTRSESLDRHKQWCRESAVEHFAPSPPFLLQSRAGRGETEPLAGHQAPGSGLEITSPGRRTFGKQLLRQSLVCSPRSDVM